MWEHKNIECRTTLETECWTSQSKQKQNKTKQKQKHTHNMGVKHHNPKP
jgi:hypothetical protein